MTLLDLCDVTFDGPSLNDMLARYFLARPNVWIDGRDLSTVAGAYAWRSRCSDLRKPPYSLTIENRMRRMAQDGRRWTVSEYRVVR